MSGADKVAYTLIEYFLPNGFGSIGKNIFAVINSTMSTVILIQTNSPNIFVGVWLFHFFFLSNLVSKF